MIFFKNCIILPINNRTWYDEEGSITIDISTKDGKVLDFETYGITIMDNRFEKVAINILKVEIQDNKYYIYSKFNY